MPGVPVRTGFTKAISGKKQVISHRKQAPSLTVSDSPRKSLIFEDIKVPFLLSIITQD